MQLYVSFSLLISPGQKNLYSAKDRKESGINSPYWLYTPANAWSFSLCAMTTMWHFQEAKFADIMSLFNAIFCTSFISSHLSKRLWRKTELCRPQALPRTLPTFHRLGTTQCEAWHRVCCRSAVSLFAMLQIINIIIFALHMQSQDAVWIEMSWQWDTAFTLHLKLCRNH